MRSTIVFLALLVVALTTPSLLAQTPAATTTAPTDMAHRLVPRDAVACLTVRLQQIKLDQALSLLPWEIVSAGSIDQLGIDLSSIDRLDLIVGSLGDQFRAAGVLTSSTKLDPFKLNNKVFAFEGQSLRIMGQRDLENVVITPLNDNQFSLSVVGVPVPFENGEPVEGVVLKQMKRLGESGHITLVCSPEPIRQMLRQGVGGMRPELQSDISVLVEKVQLVAARAQVSINPVINVLIEAETEADAQAVEASWNKMVSHIAKEELERVPRSVGNQVVGDSMKAYLKRATSEIELLLKPTRKGNRLLIALDQRAVNLVSGLSTFINLGPTLQAAPRSSPKSPMPGQVARSRGGRPAPSRTVGMTDASKLKMLGMAAHDFEGAFRMLPNGGDATPDGRFQLSWRVRILPFLGDPELTKLFQQFKLEEPWDSPHNIQFLEKMPDIYRYSKAEVSTGYTVIQLPHGPGLISEDRQRIKLPDVQDGLSRTVLFALSVNEAAVPWTRPLDFNPNENFNFVRKDNEEYMFLLADGSIFGIPGVTHPDEVKAFFTRSGSD